MHSRAVAGWTDASEHAAIRLRYDVLIKWFGVLLGAAVCIRGMAIVLGKPGVDGLSEAVRLLREWQYDGSPKQLHPGDLGWFWRFGAQAAAAAVRPWSQDGQILTVGLLDGPKLLRPTRKPKQRERRASAPKPVEIP